MKWDDILHLGEFGSFLKMFKWDDNNQSEIPISGSNETLISSKDGKQKKSMTVYFSTTQHPIE